MPNWCETKYVIKGSKEDISNLNSIFMKLMSNETNKSGDFDKNWLGFVVSELNGDLKKIDCRGWFESVKLKNKSTLKLTTWSAWTPCYELFEFIAQKFPTLQYFFKCEECGCGLFETNDKDKKYFKYGDKYQLLSKSDIERIINVQKIMNERLGQIPNNQIYIRLNVPNDNE